MNYKMRALRERMKSLNLEGMIVTNPINIRYLTNITSEGTLLITRKENIFITYTMYIEAVNSVLTINDDIIVMDYRDITKEEYEKFFTFCENVGFEENYATYEQYKNIKQRYKANNLVETEGIIEKQRIVKDEEEINKSFRITDLILPFSKPIITFKSLSIFNNDLSNCKVIDVSVVSNFLIPLAIFNIPSIDV